jgi:predicted phosphodiesterase
MRLVIISDTHGKHRKLAPLPQGDVLIHAGDLMYNGGEIREIVDFSEWIGEQDFKHKIFVAGNHDLLFQRSPYTFVFHGLTYLEDSGVIIADPSQPKGRVHFWGSPWTPRPLGPFGSTEPRKDLKDWAFLGERGPAMKAYWDMIPNNIDVLITHGPPQGIMDYMPKYGPDLGCVELRQAVHRVQPRVHIFGHIHHSYGHQVINGVHFVNAAQVNDFKHGESPKVVNEPVVVDL